MRFRSILAGIVVLVGLCVLSLFSMSCASRPRDPGATLPSTRASTQPATLAEYITPRKTLGEVARTAHDDLYWLADDAREGRGLGTKGLEDSGQFIANRYAKLGLVPVPSIGGYFQKFNFEAGNKLGPDTRLSLNGEPLKATDFTGFVNSKSGSATGQLAFVGYAITSKEHDYDDFGGLDIKGRVALAMRWEPHDSQGKSLWEKSRGYTNEAAIARKAEQAARAGATALIFVNAPQYHDAAEPLMDPRGGLRRPSTIPVFHVTVAAANRMLTAAGAPELAALQHTIDTTGKPASRLLDGATIDANVDIVSAAAGVHNVVAMLPGKGPHADEYVIVGAHYDHVGRGEMGNGFGPVGQIHNGADDNGSGTVTVLELAEEFALAGQQYRSIIFANFTLEELGLIGSENFVEHLPVPREKIVGMLNLDMVGRMRNEYLYVGGGGTADAFDSILSTADARSPIELKSLGKGGLGPSDHLSFSKAHIPVLFFFTGMHADYHAPGDDPEKINYDGIAQVTWLSFDVIRGMCAMNHPAYVDKYDNAEPNINVRAGDVPTTRRAATITRSRVTLGVEPDYSSDQSVKGVVVSAVTPDSAAAAAGIAAEDVITKLNDRPIDNLYDLTGFLGDAKPGDVIKVTVLRKGAPVTLDVTLRPRGR